MGLASQANTPPVSQKLGTASGAQSAPKPPRNDQTPSRRPTAAKRIADTETSARAPDRPSKIIRVSQSQKKDEGVQTTPSITHCLTITEYKYAAEGAAKLARESHEIWQAMVKDQTYSADMAVVQEYARDVMKVMKDFMYVSERLSREKELLDRTVPHLHDELQWCLNQLEYPDNDRPRLSTPMALKIQVQETKLRTINERATKARGARLKEAENTYREYEAGQVKWEEELWKAKERASSEPSSLAAGEQPRPDCGHSPIPEQLGGTGELRAFCGQKL
ncbi:hypothetical protein LIA77_02793 [Sarocladium implicatum]|nr:hypothetical protein LIA77_02793 [Sarocladium implicatum]